MLPNKMLIVTGDRNGAASVVDLTLTSNGVAIRDYNGGTLTVTLPYELPAGGSDPWYQTGMEWATGTGVSDGSIPEANITREQLAAMLWRYAGEPAATGDLSAYPDAADVHADWAGTAMIWAVENGVINGSDGNLNPQDNASRAEAAAMLTRFCKNIEK